MRIFLLCAFICCSINSNAQDTVKHRTIYEGSYYKPYTAYKSKHKLTEMKSFTIYKNTKSKYIKK